MRKVHVDSRAAEELIEAAIWYEGEGEGLGSKLLDAFDHAIELLKEEPTPLTPVPGNAGKLGAKRLLLHRFPFSVVVIDRSADLVVVAVAHHSRRPGYWMDRIGA